MHKARPDVVVHTAGIPDSAHDPAHTVFDTNVPITFHVAEAVARSGVRRLVYLSSETVPGFVTAERPFVPDYLPVDEAHPVRPQDGYALSKYVGEEICAALVRRSDAAVVSVRPCLVVDPDIDLGFVARLQEATRKRVRPFPNQWSYVDAEDLADLIVLAAEADTTGHEVVYAAQPDTCWAGPSRSSFGSPTVRTLPRCARCPGRTRAASRSIGPGSCWAGTPPGPGGTA